ncbi:MAG: hypothetical protein K8E24_012800, partial [Methanobacterium paludis]|nr:hypothetical protein [Methanobacterium paludis]
SSIEPLEYSPNKIRKIEESFKEKFNFLVKHDVINDPYGDIKTTLDTDTAKVIKICHSIRNSIIGMF